MALSKVEKIQITKKSDNSTAKKVNKNAIINTITNNNEINGLIKSSTINHNNFSKIQNRTSKRRG